MKIKVLILSACFLPVLNTFAGTGKVISLSGPDGNLKISISDKFNNEPLLNYSVTFQGQAVILPSGTGFILKNGENTGKNQTIASIRKTEVRQSWKPVYGDRIEIPDNYNQVEVILKASKGSQPVRMIFRAYNEGIAWCYTFPKKSSADSLIIEKEITELRFSGNFPVWVAARAQAQYRKVPVSAINEAAERPLVIEAGDSLYFAAGEAKLINFPRMKFVRSAESENTIRANLEESAKIKLPYTTPWRYIMVGKTPGQLLENNYLLQNLNDPCAISDVSFIRPGKVIREVTLTTQGGKACVDFAASHGIRYVEFDAGWYGPENSDKSDATGVHVDPARSAGPLDLKEVITYAGTKDVGIIVYVNRRALERQIDTILPLYKSWGIKGVKYGFVQVGSQKWTTWLHEAVKKAAQNHLMIDIHDEYRPTGFSRTYPNLLTQEGIRGDEESPSNGHTLITLFTRMIAGPGDNTICYYAPRVDEKMGGHVSQLAKAIMLYSPWQFIYWYDRPQGSPGRKGGAGNSEGYIQNDRELQLFDEIPTVWDQLKVIEGKIGEYATIARRTGSDWYIGSLTADNARDLKLLLNFLDSGVKYEATIYSYDPGLATPTKVKIEKQVVSSVSSLGYRISANSGLAIQLKKIRN